MHGEKQDKNAKLLDTIYTAFGAWPQSMPGKVGYDRAVFYNFRAVIVEYKSDHKQKLTKNEREVRTKVEQTGVSYHVVVTPDEALVPLGIKFDDLTTSQLWWLSDNLAGCNPYNDNYTQQMIDDLAIRLSDLIAKRGVEALQ